MLRAGCVARLPDHELYKKERIPACVWNGIVHSLCHIGACLTRQNKSFSIFQHAGTARLRRRGSSAALLPPPASSFPICCPALSSEVLFSPLRLHHPEKHYLRIPSTAQHLHIRKKKPTRFDSKPSLSPIYHFSICPVPQAAFVSAHNPF